MRKLLYAGALTLGTFSLLACERTERTTSLEANEDNKVVVETDSVPTEYEVTETVVEYDTTTRTKTVDATKAKDDRKDKE